MLPSQPLSLGQVTRLAGSADTVLVGATREADLETPIGAFLALDDGSPAYLLESVERGERLARYSFLGVMPRRIMEIRDDGRATVLSRAMLAGDVQAVEHVHGRVHDPLVALRGFLPRRRVVPRDGMPAFTGGAVGVLAYDAVATFEPSVPLPPADPIGAPVAAFLETDLVLVFDHLTHTLSAIASLHTDAPHFAERYRTAERAVHEALERAAGPASARPEGSRPATISAASSESLGEEAYEHAASLAVDAIRAGECIQVVLARRRSYVYGAGSRTSTGIELYRALRRVSPSPYLFYVRLPECEVVGASPERLVQVVGDRVATHAIAGTRPRGASEDEDRRLAAELLGDPKERSEHVMLVDLARNDVGRVAAPGSVRLTRFAQVERFSHVQHLVSQVEGRLRPGLDALDALRAVFPAGTLSGAPKIRAMQLIAELENERRGLYGGAVGYLGYDGSLDTAIVIRSAVMSAGAVHVQSGAGIVAASDPVTEYQETEHKARAVLRAIESVRRSVAADVTAEAGAA